MDLTGGLLSREVNSIAGNKTKHKRLYSATILAGPYEVKALSVGRIDLGSDFEKKYRDDITITLLLPLGGLMTKVAPYQDDLRIILRESSPESYEYIETTYKAYLMEDMPNDIERSSNPAFRDTEISNRAGNINVSFSVTLPIVEYLDAIHTGTVVREVPPFSVLKVLFDQYLSQINFTLDDALVSVSMVEPSNYQPRSQIVIPHNTKLVHLPQMLQDELGGIYSAGLGFYLRRRSLHFWPLYDTDIEGDVKDRLHVYMPVSSHSSVLDSTYKKVGGIVSIIASGKPKIIDDTLGQTYYEGDSLRFVDGNEAFKAMGDVKGGVITSNRASRNVESTLVSTAKVINTVAGGSTRITSNIYKEMSDKAKLNGYNVIIQWRYSRHDLIKPGMPVILFMNMDGDIKEVNGIVLSIHSKYEMESEGITNKALVASSVLRIFVKRDDWRMDSFVKSGQQRNINTTK